MTKPYKYRAWFFKYDANNNMIDCKPSRWYFIPDHTRKAIKVRKVNKLRLSYKGLIM